MRGSRAVPRVLDPAVLFVVAFGVRLAIVLISRGGPLGDFGYDSGVYYSAADALIHGRMPYADFTLLHPPGLMLVLTPFASLGTLTSDHTGFVVANTAFEALGAVNAVLVLLVARRAGAGRAAALAGGLLYALWPGAAGAEISARLEPLGNFFLLCALLIFVVPSRSTDPKRRMLLCGVLLGAAAMTKIWWIVPLVILAVWALRRGRRPGGLLLAGAAAGMIVIGGPFFLRAPSDMWRMVVRDQLGRPSVGGSIAKRVIELSSLSPVLPRVSHRTADLILVPVVVIVVAVLVRAWRCVPLRPVLTVAAAQLLVLLFAPTYFGFYADYLAPGAGLVLAAVLAPGVTTTAVRTKLRATAWVICVGAVAVSAVVELVNDAPSAVWPFPGAQLAAATARADPHCVMADSPLALIELDVLSQGLGRGCPNRIDVSGSTYDRDRPATSRHVPRVRNLRWQHDIYHYLTSGNAEIVIRHATGLSPATERKLDRLPALFTIRGHTMRRTP